jgi:Gas vesicle synthesis protein GvpL/GvpF
MAAVPVPEDAGWYLYGVVGGRAEPPTPDVVVLGEGPVAGLASRVSLVEFDEASLPQRLADAAWLEEKIRGHEQVLESALAAGPVVPCRFCTVYRDEHELRRFLADQADVLTSALERLEGRVELGVKAFVAVAPPSEAVEAESGRAYLEARRREKQEREELAQTRAALAHDLHRRLLATAEDGVLLDLQSRELSGRDAEMIFNGSYLVADRARFEDALVEAAPEGFDLELTGPWPPYNFVPEELARP